MARVDPLPEDEWGDEVAPILKAKPPGTDAPLGRLATQLAPQRAEVHIPLDRQGTAWEVAYAALFLMSDESSYMTGQSLVVDGGLGVAFRS